MNNQMYLEPPSWNGGHMPNQPVPGPPIQVKIPIMVCSKKIQNIFSAIYSSFLVRQNYLEFF